MAENQEISPTLLRLTRTTKDALRDELQRSSHRSMSALADDILSRELSRRREESASGVDRMLAAARKVGA